MDYHLIMDLIPTVARIFFLKQLGDTSLSAAQCVSFPICYGLSFIAAMSSVLLSYLLLVPVLF